MEDGASLEWLLDVRLDPDVMAYDHAMDISATVYMRMKELGLKRKDLAARMGVDKSCVSKILKGEQNLTIKTLARLESALEMDMSAGFRSPEVKATPRLPCR